MRVFGSPSLFFFFFFGLFFFAALCQSVCLSHETTTFRTLAEDGRGQEQKQDDRDERNELVLSKLQTNAKII